MIQPLLTRMLIQARMTAEERAQQTHRAVYASQARARKLPGTDFDSSGSNRTSAHDGPALPVKGRQAAATELCRLKNEAQGLCPLPHIASPRAAVFEREDLSVSSCQC